MQRVKMPPISETKRRVQTPEATFFPPLTAHCLQIRMMRLKTMRMKMTKPIPGDSLASPMREKNSMRLVAIPPIQLNIEAHVLMDDSFRADRSS